MRTAAGKEPRTLWSRANGELMLRGSRAPVSAMNRPCASRPSRKCIEARTSGTLPPKSSSRRPPGFREPAAGICCADNVFPPEPGIVHSMPSWSRRRTVRLA
jgi:hypothetical protein